jgi:ceroid-lipofuscinosis MFS transporter 7
MALPLNDSKDEKSTSNTTESSSPTSLSRHYSILLLPQCFVGFVDAISFMIVTPSLVFYVLSFGGTKEQYGIILSIFSLASFLFKPVLGYWCDTTGNQFRIPYIVSLVIAAIGGLLYFLASAYTGPIALALVLLSRFMGGVGAANSTLGFTYIAAVIPHQQMTKATAILSMVRIFGMAVAPGLNVFLSKINYHIFSLPITPLNSTGLVLFGLNVISVFVIYFVQKEPHTHISSDEISPVMNGRAQYLEKHNGWQILKSVLAIDFIVPILCTLSLNASFQLLETGLAPASHHALDWTPVEISTVFGANSIWIFALLTLTYWLSSAGVSDVTMLIIGLIASTTGYTLLYILWTMDTSTLLFVMPLVITSLSFPFMAAPARSLFTRVVDSKATLRNSQGTMQAIMSMAASVAGFAAPGLIATYVLRTPEQVEASMDHRELTPYALFAPTVSVIVLSGVLYMYFYPTKATVVADEDDPSTSWTGAKVDERTGLLATETVRTCRRSQGSSIMGVTDLSGLIDTASGVAWE